MSMDGVTTEVELGCLRQRVTELEQLLAECNRTETLLRAERDYLAEIIQGTPALIVGIAPDGTTRSVNPAVEHTSGYAADELVGRNWWDTFYPGAEYAQVEQLFRDFERGPVRDYEMVL